MNKKSCTQCQWPIGVFDSGIGGLTVLQALQEQLPHESFLYFGDTARLPYGTKSASTISQYALQATTLLVRRGIKLLVIACNTVSALALPVLQKKFPGLSIIGVLEPGAEAACRASLRGLIAVIATEATVNAKSYHYAIYRHRPDAKVIAQGCSLFVALAEEGLTEGPIVRAVAEWYLQPLFHPSNGEAPDCLVLGCTHFPLLTKTIRKVVSNSVSIIDSAHTTALTVAKALKDKALSNPRRERGEVKFLVSDDSSRFRRIGRLFLERELLEEDVELVDFSHWR